MKAPRCGFWPAHQKWMWMLACFSCAVLQPELVVKAVNPQELPRMASTRAVPLAQVVPRRRPHGLKLKGRPLQLRLVGLPNCVPKQRGTYAFKHKKISNGRQPWSVDGQRPQRPPCQICQLSRWRVIKPSHRPVVLSYRLIGTQGLPSGPKPRSVFSRSAPNGVHGSSVKPDKHR
jgi:hypothetical protein